MTDVDLVQAQYGGTLYDWCDEKIRDGNFATNTTWYASVNTGGPPDPSPPNAGTNVQYTVGFSTYATVTDVRWAGGVNGNAGNTSANAYLYICQDPAGVAWTQIDTVQYRNVTTGSWDRTISTGWKYVTGVRIYCSVWSAIGVSRCWPYEIQAHGLPMSQGYIL